MVSFKPRSDKATEGTRELIFGEVGFDVDSSNDRKGTGTCAFGRLRSVTGTSKGFVISLDPVCRLFNDYSMYSIDTFISRQPKL